MNQTSPRKKSVGLRIDAPTFILHWGLVIVLGVSLFTGLRIASDYSESLAGSLARQILWLLPEGQVIEWHVLSSWILTLVAVAYALFIWRSRQSGRIRLQPSHLRALDRARENAGDPGRVAVWFAINRILFQIAFGLIVLLALTGMAMYRQAYLGIPPLFVATVHGVAALAIIAYVGFHVLGVIMAGTFWKMFRPRPKYAVAATTALVVTGILVGSVYVADRAVHQTLLVARVTSPPLLTGDGSDPAWAEARPVEVRTVRGANLPNGESVVELRAVHDGESIYFLFRWADPQRSQKMHPLIRREEGWRVLQSQLEINDENGYYEDKFAVIFSHRPALASGTTHLGQDLLEGPHYRNPRGLHYTEDDSVVDLWHWKSVRSGGMTPGFVDDNHIGPPLPSEAVGARYTGGYTQDPPGTPHPYLQNWIKTNPDLPLSETPVLPRFLPRSEAVLARLGPVDLDPSGHDEGAWFMRIDETVPYDAELDDYPLGTVLPGIILEGLFSGDRSDVRAEASWADGHWTLEAMRTLDTGSDYDVAFGGNLPVYLWVAVFNHTQTRHSQHLQPVRLVLE